jgi:hypothetical protein
MRGRKPRDFSLAAHDVPIRQQIARSRILPWFQVQRARVVLAIADGERVQTVAVQLQCDPSTVWRFCRRYEQAGLEGLLSEAPRSGHPMEISPSAARSDRATGLSGAVSSRGCLLPIGPARIWLARLSPTGLYRASVPVACSVSCVRSTCSLIVRAIGKRRAWTRGSNNGRRRFCGVMPPPRAWCAAAFGSPASTRYPISKRLSATPSVGRFPARSNSRSSSTSAMVRSMCWCF